MVYTIKKPNNSSYMKHMNRQLVLNFIKKSQISRAELSKATALSRAAITLIVDELLKDGLVIEKGIKESNYGRKPILLKINENRYYAVGVNISRTKCTMGILNLKGEIITKQDIDISNCLDAKHALKIIAEEIEASIEKACIRPEDVLGIGVTTPGPVDIKEKVVLNPPNFDIWHRVRIEEELQLHLDYEIVLENISLARAVAEKNYGKGEAYNSFMMVVVDEGIGAGIVLRGELYHGESGHGSEFGHMSVNFNGEVCDCGNKGCLEGYAAIPNLLRNYDTKLMWKDVVEGAIEGKQEFLYLVDLEAQYLAAGIVNIVNLLEINAVILTGDILYKPELLINKISHYVQQSAMTRAIHHIKILDSSITQDSEIISAASIIIEKFFSLK